MDQFNILVGRVKVGCEDILEEPCMIEGVDWFHATRNIPIMGGIKLKQTNYQH